jgi:hypothetical protein
MVTTYRSGSGRLVVDRYDFQNHIDGYNLNHPASAVLLEEPIVIYTSEVSYVEATTVQEALSAFSEVVIPYSIPDASSVNRGLIKLAGDISGSALAPTIVAIQGKPINTVVPSDGDVLTWNSAGSTWGPDTPTNVFVAAQDLSGTATAQVIVGITGSGGIVDVAADVFRFSETSLAAIQQVDHTTDDATDITILAQSTTATNKNGGNVRISGGSKNGAGVKGGVSLFIDSTNTSMMEAKEITVGQRILGLLNGSTEVSTTQMPSGTGDMVIFIKDAATAPSSGSPVGGSILYSNSGQLYVKESSGSQFLIGSTPNPSTWGTYGQYTYKYRILSTSTTSTAITALTFAIPDDSSIRVNARFIGKKDASAEAGNYDVAMGYLRSAAGAPVAVGTVSVTDTREEGASTPWTAPTITVSGNNLLVKTGYKLSTTINWYADITIYVCSDS